MRRSAICGKRRHGGGRSCARNRRCSSAPRPGRARRRQARGARWRRSPEVRTELSRSSGTPATPCAPPGRCCQAWQAWALDRRVPGEDSPAPKSGGATDVPSAGQACRRGRHERDVAQRLVERSCVPSSPSSRRAADTSYLRLVSSAAGHAPSVGRSSYAGTRSERKFISKLVARASNRVGRVDKATGRTPTGMSARSAAPRVIAREVVDARSRTREHSTHLPPPPRSLPRRRVTTGVGAASDARHRLRPETQPCTRYAPGRRASDSGRSGAR